MTKPAYQARFKKSRMENKNIREKLLKRKGVVDVEDIEKAADEAAQNQPSAPEPKPAEKKEDTPPKREIKRVSLYTPFCRVNKEKREVSGIATNEAVDSYGDIVRFDAIKEALPDYLEFSNIREMHQPSAAGKVVDHELNEDEKALYITCKVVDDNAWNKVLEGVYKGFSIGGEILEAAPLMATAQDEDGNEHEVMTGGLEITKIKLIEISLVDRPANPEALIESYKMAKNAGFIPDVALVPSTKSLNKSEESLTSHTTVDKMEASHLQTSDNEKKLSFTTNFVKTMDKKSLFAKAWASVTEFFKSNDIDLEDTAKADVEITITRGELHDIVKDAVEKAVVVETKKADEAKGDEDPAPTEGDEPEGTEGDEPTEPTEPAGDEGKVGDAPTEPAGGDAEKSVNADIAKALTSLAEGMKGISDNLAKSTQSNEAVLTAVQSLQKAAGVSSAQKGDAKLRKSEAKDPASFKGVF